MRWELSSVERDTGGSAVLVRGLWLTVGCLALLLGIAGLVLPILPTTPFVLLAAYGFSRSSARFHHWLLRHPFFGKLIQDWQREGAISQAAKAWSVVCMAGVFAASVAMRIDARLLIMQAFVLTLAGAYVLTRPTPKRRS